LTPARTILFIIIVLGAALQFSCASKSDKSAPEKHYKMTGVVLSLDRKLQTANIKHEDIPGWMEAMTMDYPIRSKQEFEKLRVGEAITATVNVRGVDYDVSDIHERTTKK
jgi:protein SCO1/2